MTKNLSASTLFLLISILFTISFTGSANGQSAFGAGVRLHTDHSAFKSLPFSHADLTYLLYYEVHEAGALLQLNLGYTPEPGEGSSIDTVWTPQANLIIKDSFWRGGVGILSSYIESDIDNDNGWTDYYWQFITGIHISFFEGIGIDINSYYIFENWGKLNKFDFRDIESGVSINFSF